MSTQLTRPDAEELLHRLSKEAGRRRRRRRNVRALGALVAVALAGGTLVWATGSLFGLRADRTQPADADRTAYGTYGFTDVRVTEYVDPRTGEPDPNVARVEFRADWTTDRYPGMHQCTWTVYGADGRVVGTRTGELGVLGDPADGPPMRTLVPVSEQGERAEILCDPERLDTPAAYEISDVLVEPLVEEGRYTGIEVVFQVAWPSEVRMPDYPGDNWCVVTVRRHSGEVLWERPFTLAVPPGRESTHHLFEGEFVTAVVDRDRADALDATVRCEPYTGASDQTR